MRTYYLFSGLGADHRAFQEPSNTVHIHGTADRILPFRFVKADYVIPGGSHLMVVNRAKEISDIIAGIG
ncbi:hypothetical protein [Parapedobacter sp. DT-150]|uniref:hypothetical protein n=1 Tax=Parapedobacter sp. DT-150 TaxID=3396162 RepID=UPI003F1D19CD